ncbi:hypothetical protein DICSQDRAFT_175696, partial [Dichomitus squalens LYAD-421 SS1]
MSSHWQPHLSTDERCPGCTLYFSPSGLSKHLAQTRKPACIAVRDGRLPPPPTAQPLGQEDDSNVFDDVDMDAPPVPLEGDFYGDYDPSFFDDESAPDSPHGDSDFPASDDDDDDLQPTLRAGSPSPVLCLPTLEATSRSRILGTYVIPFPGHHAGAPIPRSDVPRRVDANEKYQACLNEAPSTNPYHPFASRRDWLVGHWAKMRGPGSTAFSELLAIDEVAQLLALSYKNSQQLDKIIDKELPPCRPRFQRHEIVVAGEAIEVYFRDVLECIRSLFSNPEFAPLLLLVPERHYADADHTVRVYFDMNTGKWWWATQKELEKRNPGATVVPIVISSDKTQLTLIGNKTAYPVYMTLGNLPKDVRSKPSRRGQILLAYLPTSKLQHIPNKAARRRTLANLFHACMARVLTPLSSVGVTGMELMSGDGVVRRGHPILAVYVGDYPEQLLVSGCKTGECPKCPIPRDEVGSSSNTSRALRDLGKVFDALSALDEGPTAFSKACHDAGIKPLPHPFWLDLPFTNIYMSITPDILHQLYQGVMKHLILWLQEACGEDEIDARC